MRVVPSHEGGDSALGFLSRFVYFFPRINIETKCKFVIEKTLCTGNSMRFEVQRLGSGHTFLSAEWSDVE